MDRVDTYVCISILDSQFKEVSEFSSYTKKLDLLMTTYVLLYINLTIN
jgi:hypothetical protein